MYRAVPKDIKEDNFRNGDWVTPSREYARQEGRMIPGGYRVIAKNVKLKNIWWDGNSINEFGYDDGKEYAYKNTKNNRKLTDVITRDRNGEIVPPSKRFNARAYEIYYQTEHISEAFPMTTDMSIDGKNDTDEQLIERIQKVKLLRNFAGIEIKPGKEKTQAEAKDAVKKIGPMKNKWDGKKATLPVESVGKIIGHQGVKVTRILEDIKQLFETSIPGWSEREELKAGHKEHPNFEAYLHYINRFRIGTDEYFIRFTVTEERARDKKDKRREIHSSALSRIDIYLNGEASQPDGLKIPGETKSPFHDKKIQEFFNSVKGKKLPENYRESKQELKRQIYNHSPISPLDNVSAEDALVIADWLGMGDEQEEPTAEQRETLYDALKLFEETGELPEGGPEGLADAFSRLAEAEDSEASGALSAEEADRAAKEAEYAELAGAGGQSRAEALSLIKKNGGINYEFLKATFGDESAKVLRKILGPAAFRKNGLGLDKLAQLIGISEDDLYQLLLAKPETEDREASREPSADNAKSAELENNASLPEIIEELNDFLASKDILLGAAKKDIQELLERITGEQEKRRLAIDIAGDIERRESRLERQIWKLNEVIKATRAGRREHAERRLATLRL
jgi:hypothetical protein